VAVVSVMYTGLNKDFNLWDQLAPYATKLVSQEIGSNWRAWLGELGGLARELMAIPARTGRVLAQVERGDLMVQMPAVTRHLTQLERAMNRLAAGIIFAAFLLGGVSLYAAGKIPLSGVLLGGAAVTLVWIVFFNRGRGPHMRP